MRVRFPSSAPNDKYSMKLVEILEARSNSDLNTRYKSGAQELLQWTRNLRTRGNEQIGIHMGAINKLGINPGEWFTEDTPRGIYFYPYGYWTSVVGENQKLPTAGNMPYIHGFTYDSSKEYTGSRPANIDSLVPILRKYNIADHVIDNAVASSKGKYAQLYQIVYSCLYETDNQLPDQKNITVFNNILRAAGYTCIVDYGHGYIAPHEPFQGVILDPSIIKQRTVVRNYTRQK